MTLDQLKERVDWLVEHHKHPIKGGKMGCDQQVKILIESPRNFVCPDGAVVGIDWIGLGIDWHGHEILIKPKGKLKLVDGEIEKFANGELD